MAAEQKSGDFVGNGKKIGEVKIAADVVGVIAGLAATEIEGVASMAADSGCASCPGGFV